MAPMNVWRRKVHLLPFSTWIAITVIAIYLCVLDNDAANYVFAFVNPYATFVGIVAAIASLLFVAGFITNRWIFMSWALMLATGVFVARGVLHALEVGFDSFSMWISFALAVGSVSCWLIERERHR